MRSVLPGPSGALWREKRRWARRTSVVVGEGKEPGSGVKLVDHVILACASCVGRVSVQTSFKREGPK